MSQVRIVQAALRREVGVRGWVGSVRACCASIVYGIILERYCMRSNVTRDDDMI